MNKIFNNIILGFILLTSQSILNKVRLLTFHYNRPDLIEMQYRTLKKFLKDDYELIVFNDAPNDELCEKIKDICAKFEIQCVRFEQDLHHKTDYLISEIEKWATMPGLTGLSVLPQLKGKHPSVRHCQVIQYALDNFAYNYDDIVGLVDGDIFLVKDFSIREYMKKHDVDIVGTHHYDETKSVEFFAVTLCFFDMGKLPNKDTLRFNLSRIHNHITDSGGHSYYYLRDNPTVKSKKVFLTEILPLANLDINSLKNMGYGDKEIKFIKNVDFETEFHLDGNFLHYLRNSFEAQNKAFHNHKTEVLNNFMEDILNN